ncbi:MAG TPA: TIGR04283 family arsenosugar biosynthesis glycosyltransferase [Verrucomicrobiae bacterium]|nr:TIGR04283 family arsenosugar biosynthesis glycosyltransferase [Verrucomicrobiae bacterium]
MISIVIPTLNEAELLPGSLGRIGADIVPHEIVVVDGGSSDASVRIAEAAKCRVLQSAERHRAKQMNLGAANAQGDVLLFLHADTLIPPEGLRAIESVLKNERVVGGGFRRRYVNAPAFLQFTCAMADWRGRWLGWHFGDQGIFVRRAAFEALGGFRELAVFEDVDLCRRMKKVGRVVGLRPQVLSSARRFAKRGALVTSLADLWLTCRYVTGAHPDRLAAGAQRHRAKGYQQ